MKRLNVVLEDDMHTKLKMTAFEQGITISQYVKNVLEKNLNGQQDAIREEKQEDN